MTAADHANTVRKAHAQAMEALAADVHGYSGPAIRDWEKELEAALDALQTQAETGWQSTHDAEREQQIVALMARAEAAEAERDQARDALDAIERELGTVPLDQLSLDAELAVSKAWAMAREKRPDPELIPAPIARAALGDNP